MDKQLTNTGSRSSYYNQLNGKSNEAFLRAGHWISRGTSEYRRTSFAMFLAGFATFSLLYCVQPLLPLFSTTFGISSTESSLALTFTTGLLSASILLATVVSEALGYRRIMFMSILGTSLLNLVAAFFSNWNMLLLIRASQGVLLSGVPGVALAYLAEKINPRDIGSAVGLYVAGTAFGGMTGRVGTGIVAEYFPWQVGLGLIGAAGLISASGFIYLLPTSDRFKDPSKISFIQHLSMWKEHLFNLDLRSIYVLGFLSMGAFVALYNYSGFRLMDEPYGLSSEDVGLIFIVFLFGVAASYFAGAWADRVGQRLVLSIGLSAMIAGLVATFFGSLIAIVCGIAIFTMGFFCVHSVISGMIGRHARHNRGHATSMYLFCYYAGSSFIGSMGGLFWDYGKWNAIGFFLAGLLLIAFLIALKLRQTTGQNPGHH